MSIEDVVVVATVREEIRRKKRPFDAAGIQRLIEVAQIRMAAHVASDNFTPDDTPDGSENEAAEKAHLCPGNVCERGPLGGPLPIGPPPDGLPPCDLFPGAPPTAPPTTPPTAPRTLPPTAPPTAPPGARLPNTPTDDLPEAGGEQDEEELVDWAFPKKKKKKGGNVGGPAGSASSGRPRTSSWWSAPPPPPPV